jgi:hypothetical protein
MEWAVWFAILPSDFDLNQIQGSPAQNTVSNKSQIKWRLANLAVLVRLRGTDTKAL